MNFCIKCGTELHGALICPNCGAVVNKTEEVEVNKKMAVERKGGLKAFISKCGLVSSGFMIRYTAAVLGLMIIDYVLTRMRYDFDISFFTYWSFNIYTVSIWLQVIAPVCAIIMGVTKSKKVSIPVFTAVLLSVLNVLINLFNLFRGLFSGAVGADDFLYGFFGWHLPFALLAGISIYFISKKKLDVD